MSDEGAVPAPRAGQESAAGDSPLLVDIAHVVLGRSGGEAWQVEPRPFWCLLTPPGHGSRHHGWKLHAPLRLTPRGVALVTYQENLFLAEGLVPGVTLRQWAERHATGDWQGRGASLAEAVRLARHLVEIVAAVHGQGLVLRDLRPNNIMVSSDEWLRLVDLEHAVPAGSRAVRAHTLAYASAERARAPQFGPVPSQLSDLFSLGATIIYLASGVDPLLPADEPAQRPTQERLAALVTLLGLGMPAVRHLAPLMLGLTRDDSGGRWSLAQAREFLAASDPAAGGGRRGAGTADGVGLLGGRRQARWQVASRGRRPPCGGRAVLRALDLAKKVPVEWPNPDICHGAAGAGMAQLHPSCGSPVTRPSVSARLPGRRATASSAAATIRCSMRSLFSASAAGPPRCVR